MSAADRHDPFADPLTPYWRAKVEAAAAGLPMPTPPRGRSLATLDGPDALFAKLWNAEAPAWAIAQHAGFGNKSGAFARFRRLRLQGYALRVRGAGWQPPADWRQRVDRIIELGG